MWSFTFARPARPPLARILHILYGQERDAMEPYPHHYVVDAKAAPPGSVTLAAAGLPSLPVSPPAQFDGPGDQWSPETLFVGAVVSCFILTFRAVARASNLSWTDLQCHAAGTLERAEGTTRFTQLELQARLTVPAGTDGEKARRLLEKAEKACLITNSLAFAPTLVSEVHSEESKEIAA
jgi:peroxiredoxin-like protein